mmetsp:Transcript_102226/g.305165  ORF Transcript_102226/g.305165 Transcript_102226/m.305165 type:complete len:222 (+) Transcript_102226:167-832(+)
MPCEPGEHADGAEARVSALRSWALSLASRQSQPGRPEDDLAIVLPLLRPSEVSPEEGDLLQAGLARSRPEAAPGETAEQAQRLPPKVSQLGNSVPPWAGAFVALEAPLDWQRAEMVLASASASGTGSAGRPPHWLLRPAARAESRAPGPPSAPPRARPRRQRAAPARSHTICRPPGRPPVRGSDPLAGSLFSRDAALDQVSRRRGLYEGHLLRQQSNRRLC